MQTFAVAFAAKVVREGIQFQETKQREELANAILKRSTRETKLVFCLESKHCFRGVAATVLGTLASRIAK